MRNKYSFIIFIALTLSLLLIVYLIKNISFTKHSSLVDIPPLYPQAEWGEYQKAFFLGVSQYLIKSMREVVGVGVVGTLKMDDLSDFIIYYKDELKKRGWQKTHQLENDRSGTGLYVFSKIAGLSPDIISRFFFHLKVIGYYMLNKPLPFQERHFKMSYEKQPYNIGKYNVLIQHTDYISQPQ